MKMTHSGGGFFPCKADEGWITASLRHAEHEQKTARRADRKRKEGDEPARHDDDGMKDPGQGSTRKIIRSHGPTDTGMDTGIETNIDTTIDNPRHACSCD